MPMSRMFSVLLMTVGAATVYSQDFPNKPIRIVTTGIGSGSDFMARIIGPGISGTLGQSVIVDNRHSNLVGEIASRAPPDGYTLLLAGGAFMIGPLLQKLSYDPVRDFAPITLALRAPSVLVVHPSLQVKSVTELIALAKAKPGVLNYASGGTGGTSHLAGALFAYMAGVNIVRITYKSDSQEMADLLSGQTQLIFQDSSKAAQHVQSGKLRALAVTSAEPSALAPGLPTVAASLPGFESVTMTGIFAPAKTPMVIIQRLNQDLVRVLNRSDIKQKFFESGAETVGSSPEQLAVAMKSNMAMMGKMIKDAGIKPD